MAKDAGRDAIGVDVGGTSIKAARLDAEGRMRAQAREPVSQGSAESLLEQIRGLVRHLDGARPAAAVGVGLPGILDGGSGRLRNAPNLPALNGVEVGAELGRRTGRPTYAENDANAAALAEAWLGAGRGSQRLLFVTLGTGVGGALVLHGRLWGGRSGYAGEIGHIQADPGGVPCGCGSWGCVETIAGAPGWERRAAEALPARESSLRGSAVLDPAAIVAAARSGDGLAGELLDEAARAVGLGVAAALNLLNLDRVVIGGGVSEAGELLLDRIVEHVRRRTFAHVFADASFALAELGPDAGVIGAARVAMLQALPAWEPA